MKRFLQVILGLILLLAWIVGVLYAAGVALPWWWTESATSGYLSPTSGSNKDIVLADSNCIKLTSTTNTRYFIPTKTSAESTAFQNNLPSWLSVWSCVVPVDAICSGSPFQCTVWVVDPNSKEREPYNGYPRGCTYTWTCDSTTGGNSAYCNTTVWCFAPEELVSTPSWPRPISSLKAGDTVISYDESSQKFVENTIDRVIIHDGENAPLHDFETHPLILLTTEVNWVKKDTKVTTNHLYFSPDENKYKEVGTFLDGDRIQTVNGIWTIVSRKVIDSVPVVYNLHMVAAPNNYLVNDVVVHNEKAEACTACAWPTCWWNSYNGECGTANGTSSATYPSSNHCAAGIKVNVDIVWADNVYNWRCDGTGGGSNVSCSAMKTWWAPSCAGSFSSNFGATVFDFELSVGQSIGPRSVPTSPAWKFASYCIGDWGAVCTDTDVRSDHVTYLCSMPSSCSTSCWVLNPGEACDEWDGAAFGSCSSAYIAFDGGRILAYCDPGTNNIIQCADFCSTELWRSYWNSRSFLPDYHCPLGITIKRP